MRLAHGQELEHAAWGWRNDIDFRVHAASNALATPDKKGRAPVRWEPGCPLGAIGFGREPEPRGFDRLTSTGWTWKPPPRGRRQDAAMDSGLQSFFPRFSSLPR